MDVDMVGPAAAVLAAGADFLHYLTHAGLGLVAIGVLGFLLVLALRWAMPRVAVEHPQGVVFLALLVAFLACFVLSLPQTGIQARHPDWFPGAEGTYLLPYGAAFYAWLLVWTWALRRFGGRPESAP